VKKENKKTKKAAKLKKLAVIAQSAKEQESFWQKFFSGLKNFLKIVGWIVGGALTIALLFFGYINLPVKEVSTKAVIGTTFSLRYAQDIGLDWRQAYVAMLDDLKIRYIRLPVYWDKIETSNGQYDFSDIDWQLGEAKQRGAKIILAFGQKTPRWPECFIPKWIGVDDAKRKERLLAFEKVVVERYRDNHPEIIRWQVENEPFLDFGICPPINPALVDNEVAQVKSLDTSKPIMLTDGGEATLWIEAAKRADIFGTTMYREVISPRFGYWKYPLGPNFFKAKQLLIRIFAHQNNTIVIELQGEPWIQGWTTAAPIETQLASMDAAKLADNVSFAKKTGMKEVYIWGVEWWYWMKMEQNNSTLWEQAKEIIQLNTSNN